MAEPLIRLEHISRTYHVGDIDVHALDDVSLSIEAGEFVAIMGHSGSGKSTLMAILGCLDRPTSGRYFFEGTDIAGLDETERAHLRSERLGFVFQNFNLLARTSALENVALPLFYAASGLASAASRTERARDMLELLGLSDRERNTPSQLSGGQQQRVAIARALINNPGLLLADEPTGNLDSHTSDEIMETLTRLNRKHGVTIVVVTHEADVAAYADRILTVRDGKVISDTRNPKPPKVAAAGIRTFEKDAATEQPKAAGPNAVWAFSLMIMSAAVQAIRRNMMRSALTMLGVFIGVAALIAMVAVGQGANDAVRKQIERLGTNLVVVVPGSRNTGGYRGGSGSASTLTVGDAHAIQREATAVSQVAYLIRQSGQVQAGNQNWNTQIQGISANYPPMTNWRIETGRAISEDDVTIAALVVVIGETVAEQLFGSSQSPIGALIQVKGVPMRVIGLLEAKGQTPWGQDQDDLVMIPFTTAERKVLGVAAPSQAQTPLNWIYPTPPNPYELTPHLAGFVNRIYVQGITQADVPKAIEQTTEILARRHRIRPGEENDFRVRNLSQIAQTAESSSRIMALLLAAVASISLVVGGIGIMNILLVSVTERTREIGLRMAIGARRLHVLLQFLAEAVFLSVTGGVAGILMGVGFSVAISVFAGWATPISATAVLGGFFFSAAVGIFFGYYPARKAARLDPIEALRYE